MTPDKIFITEYNANVETGYFSRNKDDVFTQEYICKDALLEWAKDFKARTGWYEIEVAMDDLIDKLNKM